MIKRCMAPLDGMIQRVLAEDLNGEITLDAHSATVHEAGASNTDAAMSAALGRLCDEIAAKALDDGTLCREAGADTRN